MRVRLVASCTGKSATVSLSVSVPWNSSLCGRMDPRDGSIPRRLVNRSVTTQLDYCNATCDDSIVMYAYASMMLVRISLNSMGPTPTRTLGMRLSCNFVNVDTIVFHVHYTYTCTCAHPQRTSSRGKVCGPPRTSRFGSCRAERAARAAARRADFRPRILARKSVSVTVSVSVTSVEFKLYASGWQRGEVFLLWRENRRKFR